MTVVIGGLGSEFWALSVKGAIAGQGVTSVYVYPFPLPGGVSVRYMNEVWDSVAGDFVTWPTFNQDVNGIEYPGPGVFGVSTSNYGVQAIKASRTQQ